MHRTTTTAALLVTVAVSALSGCVTVQRPAAGTAPSLPSVPRQDGRAEPRVVQAPAKEALEMVGPPRRSAPAVPHAPAPPPPAHHRPPAAPRATAPHPRTAPRSHTPPAGLPDLSHSVPNPPDVCSLGRRYGGWAPNSPETRACEQTYGH
ncbi:hypothetical protein [Streptomyces fuscichromogenes]|uniref:Lipoprotein n=1 Tax=Streptomyces fuscichromogenes TaxID=1324013 RepID=A0A917XJ50_9ACTN|nr:hypothetical protein [Streptomyces fuscichromogenes]GGN30988.1 lipoprotein [Streptomyces fuscichromogenes]